MKTTKMIMLATVVVFTLASCRDKALEKRVAELESRLQSQGTKPTTPTQAPIPTVEQPDQKPEGPLPVIEFEKTDHDFGTITEGQKVVYTYKFRNTGSAPLIIQSAQPSCGCTAPDWTRDPIPVGGTGFVKAEFDSKGKPGMQNKSITVTSNTYPKTMQLKFKANVTPTAETSGPVK